MVLCPLLAFALHTGGLAADVVTLTPAADTTIFEENPDASDAKGPGLFAGRNTQTFIRRAFLRFDVAASVPGGSTISAVRLDLALTRANGNPVDVSLFTVSAAWGEGTSNAGTPGGSGAAATAGDATWTRRVYPGTAWITPGGDTAGVKSATSPIAATLTTYSFGPAPAMTSDVQRWLDNPAANFGWQLRADELQAAPSARRFGSRESANAAERPVLVIAYTPPGGGGGGPRAADDVPALSPGALGGLAVALAALGMLALKRQTP
jgi:hypothetical protein